MNRLADAAEALRDTTDDGVASSAQLLARVRRLRRRRLAGGALAAAVVIGVVMIGQSSDSPSEVNTAGTAQPSTMAGPSSPAALARCQSAQEDPGNRVVAAFSTTAGEVDAWMTAGGPAGGALPSNWSTGLPASAAVSVCYVDGPFHISTPPGATQAAEYRMVSFVDGTGREVAMVIGPVEQLPVEPP